MRSLSRASFLFIACSFASLAGCNSLTEPSEFKVVKETPRQQPAPNKAPEEAAPGSLAPTPPAGQEKGGDPNARAAQEASKKMAPMAMPARPPGNAGSCGE